MFNLKDDVAYSKMLKKLVTYLTKNRPNLNRYSLVRPYRSLEKWAKEYGYQGCTVNVYVRNNWRSWIHTGSFKLDGWNAKHGLNVVPFKMFTHVPNSYILTINAEHLAVSDAINIPKFTTPNYSYKFNIQRNSNGDYVHMQWGSIDIPSPSDTVTCFINSVKVLYSFIKSEIKQDKQVESSKKKTNQVSVNHYQKVIKKQNQKIKNGKYNWNSVFSKN